MPATSARARRQLPRPRPSSGTQRSRVAGLARPMACRWTARVTCGSSTQARRSCGCFLQQEPAAACRPAYLSLCPPLLVDSHYANGQSLVETTSVPGGLTNTGHLLVLTNSPATVLDYAFTTPFVISSRSTLLTLPAGTTTGGLAFWPLDNSLLITNEMANSILRYSCCSAPAAMANFASNLGSGGRLLYKIKTGYQAGVPYAFA